MKKIFICFLITFLLLFPVKVVGDDSNVSLSCLQNSSNDVECVVTINSKVEFNKLEASVTAVENDTLSFVNGGFSGSVTNGVLTVTSTEDKTNDVNIGKVVIKYKTTVTGEKRISLGNIKLYKGNEVVASLGEVEENIVVKSSSNTLSSLSVTNATLSPKFSNATTIYTATTSASEVVIKATAAPTAKIEGTGNKTLKEGSNTFKVVVTPEVGKAKTYTIIIIRESGTSSDNSLKSLSLGETLNPNFSSSVTDYQARIDKEEVTISAVANNPKATISGVGRKKLEYGKNIFKVVVTSVDNKKKIYTITIDRPDTRNENAYLKSLTINSQDIKFERDIIEYAYTVNYNVKKITIDAVAEKESSLVKVEGADKLEVGKNDVLITVTAEDGSEKTYKIVVTREEKNADNGIYLSELLIEGEKLDFIKNIFEYTIKIGDITKLNIIATPEDETYKVDITGNKNLKNGSIIKIIVTNEEGISNIYKIKIEKEEEKKQDVKVKKDTNYIPYIMTSLLGILFVTDTILLFKRKKKNTDE